MIRHRSRKAVAATTAAALLALSILGAGSALGATPSVLVGSTAFDNAASGASPSIVSIGDIVVFRTSLKNDDTSTISQLYLKDQTDATVYATTATVNNVSSNGCGNAEPLSCSWRNIKPGTEVRVTVAYRVPNPSTGVTACGLGRSDGFDAPAPDPDAIAFPCLQVRFMWSTTGASPHDGGTSHGDVWNWYDGVGISSDLVNVRSRYVYDSTLTTVANVQIVDGTVNLHATKVTGIPTDIPVTVKDGLGFTPDTNCDTEGVNCPDDVFGEYSEVDVAGGAELSAFKITLTFDAAEIPGGVNANSFAIYHWYYDEDGVLRTETISRTCTFDNPASTTPNNVACLIVKKLKGNDFEVTIWTFHNGGLRGTTK